MSCGNRFPTTFNPELAVNVRLWKPAPQAAVESCAAENPRILQTFDGKAIFTFANQPIKLLS